MSRSPADSRKLGPTVLTRAAPAIGTALPETAEVRGRSPHRRLTFAPYPPVPYLLWRIGAHYWTVFCRDCGARLGDAKECQPRDDRRGNA